MKPQKIAKARQLVIPLNILRASLKRVKWIQSFADERCNCYGVVYQACSFSYYGEHNSIFWTLDGEVFHNSLMTRNPKLSKSAAKLQEGKEHATSESLRQFRYIKFLDERWKKKCLLKEKPYPKHYDCTISVADLKRGSSFRKLNT